MPDTRTDQHDCAHPVAVAARWPPAIVLQRLLQEGTRDGAPLQLHAPWMSRVTKPGLTRRKQPRLRRSVAAPDNGASRVQSSLRSLSPRSAPNVWKSKLHCQEDHGSCRSAEAR